MSSQWTVVVAGGKLASYSLFSRRLSTTPVSGPLVFVAVGLAAGPLGLDVLSRATEPEVTRALLESALVLLLFTDAATIRARDLRREEFLPLRLLAVGLPATIVLGWLVAWSLLPGLGMWALALVAIILAPTDAALGQQAVGLSLAVDGSGFIGAWAAGLAFGSSLRSTLPGPTPQEDTSDSLQSVVSAERLGLLLTSAAASTWTTPCKPRLLALQHLPWWNRDWKTDRVQPALPAETGDHRCDPAVRFTEVSIPGRSSATVRACRSSRKSGSRATG
ncbi:cation:proton antiporter [Streptomyces anulatus]